jgi:Domain of unknown function (DUF4260)
LNPKQSSPQWILRIEGGLAAIFAGVIYARIHPNSWGIFALLFLTPDIFTLGYLKDVKFGSICYNVVHTYITPAVVAVALILTNHTQFVWLIAIWIAHIGFDRALGYGLKYPTNFKDTHLQRL